MKLEASVLSKQYKNKQVLKEVSFHVEVGEVLGVIGPNGAGKSTLLRTVSGIIDPDGGSVHLNGSPVNIRTSEQWGYLPEERGLYPQMKILDQLVHFAALKGVGQKEAREKALYLLHDWKMDQHAQAKAGDLSKGNQQRIQFLSAILHDPQVLILDEPFSGLDPVQTDWLRQQIVQFKQAGKLILYSSHHMDSVETLCDRILLLHEGQRLAYGTVAEVCAPEENVWEVVLKGASGADLKTAECLEHRDSGEYRMVKFKLNAETPTALLKELETQGGVVESVKRSKRSLHEVFVQLTSGNHVV